MTQIYYNPKNNKIVLVEQSILNGIKYENIEDNGEKGVYSPVSMEYNGYYLIGVFYNDDIRWLSKSK